jgi:putative membrane protein
MSSIVSEQDRQRLSQRIAEVEKHTAGELVTAVYSRSSSYAAHRLVWATALCWLLTAGLDLVCFSVPTFALLGSQLLLVVGLYFLFGWSPLLRAITPEAVRAKAVSDRVRLLFLHQGITETRDRSGVLIYLSELERRVEILADRGIFEHVGKAAWESLVREITASIRDQKAAEGLLVAIDRIGGELAKRFPRRDDDTNELDNVVVTEG